MKKSLIQLLAAGVIYCIFSIYLYQPYFYRFSTSEYLPVMNCVLGAMGCFILSRRWTTSFWGAFFSGALYGFGPFMLSLGIWHGMAGLLAAAVPWLFLPAAYGPTEKLHWTRIPLSVLPFLAIILFFQAGANSGFYPVATQAKLRTADLASVIVPLVSAKRQLNLVGFYHVPLAVMVMGFAMLIKARRKAVMAVLVAGVILPFCNSFLEVSPIMWWSIAAVCCSIIAGAGLQGILCAGFADRKWILASAILSMSLTIISLLLATKYFDFFFSAADGYAKLMVQSGKMYLLGGLAAGIIFFLTKTGSRMHWVRIVILCSALAVDIFLSAGIIIDQIFKL
ncbi:MAG: hypothetical protein E4H40_01815 [Candidatus Brocadiia bacterium]|nr:MAG: hypothetical protein E4H40_01815 [Candidatus Brocadiia bacterium]